MEKISYLVIVEGEFIVGAFKRKPTKSDLDDLCWERNTDLEDIEIFKVIAIGKEKPSKIHYTDVP